MILKKRNYCYLINYAFCYLLCFNLTFKISPTLYNDLEKIGIKNSDTTTIINKVFPEKRGSKVEVLVETNACKFNTDTDMIAEKINKIARYGKLIYRF